MDTILPPSNDPPQVSEDVIVTQQALAWKRPQENVMTVAISRNNSVAVFITEILTQPMNSFMQ